MKRPISYPAQLSLPFDFTDDGGKITFNFLHWALSETAKKRAITYKGLGTNLFLVYFSIPTQQLVTSFDSMIHSNIPQVSGFVPEEMIPSNRKTRHFKYGAKPGVPWNFFYYLANFSPFQRKVIFGRTWTWIRTAKTINDQKMKWNSKQKMY